MARISRMGIIRRLIDVVAGAASAAHSYILNCRQGGVSPARRLLGVRGNDAVVDDGAHRRYVVAGEARDVGAKLRIGQNLEQGG